MPKVHRGELTITSSAFEHGQRIPDRYTVSGEAVSPPLSWSKAPAETQSFALIADDPDAPLTYGFTHWVLYNIPKDAASIGEGDSTSFTSGVHGLGEPGYTAPAPPPNHGDHYYYFHLYALDSALDLEPGLDKAALLQRIDDHILVQSRLVGTFSRS